MGGTGQAAGMLRGQVFGPGGKPLPSNWSDGRRVRAAEKAPQRKRPCRSRATARRSLLRHARAKLCKGQPESVRCGRKSRITGRRRKSSLALQPLQNPFGIAANAENLLRCIGRSRWARNLSALHLQKRTSKGARHGHVSCRVSYPVLQFADMRNSYLIKQEARRPWPIP